MVSNYKQSRTRLSVWMLVANKEGVVGCLESTNDYTITAKLSWADFGGCDKLTQENLLLLNIMLSAINIQYRTRIRLEPRFGSFELLYILILGRLCVHVCRLVSCSEDKGFASPGR